MSTASRTHIYIVRTGRTSGGAGRDGVVDDTGGSSGLWAGFDGALWASFRRSWDTVSCLPLMSYREVLVGSGGLSHSIQLTLGVYLERCLQVTVEPLNNSIRDRMIRSG